MFKKFNFIESQIISLLDDQYSLSANTDCESAIVLLKWPANTYSQGKFQQLVISRSFPFAMNKNVKRQEKRREEHSFRSSRLETSQHNPWPRLQPWNKTKRGIQHREFYSLSEHFLLPPPSPPLHESIHLESWHEREFPKLAKIEKRKRGRSRTMANRKRIGAGHRVTCGRLFKNVATMLAGYISRVSSRGAQRSAPFGARARSPLSACIAMRRSQHKTSCHTWGDRQPRDSGPRL